MTRHLTLLCAGITASAAVAAWGPAPKTDRDRAELKGPVQSVSMRWQANHKDQYGSVEERELGSSTYDAAGNLLVDHEITPDFSRDKRPERHGPNETIFRSAMGSSVERYRFDAGGNMIELQTWYGEHANGAPAITQRFSYDAAGRMTKREVLAGDGTGKRLDATLYSRDAAGNVTLEEIQNTDRTPPYPRMHYSYEFDAHGNWTAKIVTRENVAEDAFEFRYAGNLFRTITYFGSN
jgi:YD repeat-containing protein